MHDLHNSTRVEEADFPAAWAHPYLSELSQNVETVVLRCFHDGELKPITLQFMNIDCALYVGSVVPLLE